jgi:hypothetical protein
VKEWLDEFYGSPEMRGALEDAYAPVFTAYAATLIENPDKGFVASLIAAFVNSYLGSSRAQLQGVLEEATDPKAALKERIGEWIEKRPGKVSKNETVRTANAVHLQEMRDQGVTRKVWRTVGKNCPYCKSLNGRTIAVEEPFFDPTDEFQPPGAERALRFNSDKHHPPIHNGCDCFIEAVTEAG